MPGPPSGFRSALIGMQETTHDYIWTQGLVAEEWDRDHHTNLACCAFLRIRLPARSVDGFNAVVCNECGHKFLWGALTLVPVAEDRAKLFQHELADQERRRAEHAQNPDVWPDRQPATDVRAGYSSPVSSADPSS